MEKLDRRNFAKKAFGWGGALSFLGALNFPKNSSSGICRPGNSHTDQ